VKITAVKKKQKTNRYKHQLTTTDIKVHWDNEFISKIVQMMIKAKK